MKSREFKFTVPSAAQPVVELSDEGLYVWFKRGAVSAQTIIRSRWPLVALDLDADGELIGIEAAPVPQEFSLTSLAHLAQVKLPNATAARARYVRAEPTVPAV